ncbi:MAG: fructose-6-phosphate aldolase [Deltaproteobacteria bacterium RIFCSPLOWO2_01_44_7]|nr:MAG: fructose-6-phosphate aldolase [Deltaproteobacteria bacterium RIFCSPHIGHO2_01_FULL_43_49]OGQ14519.1 MAG: fructose-6-phosphate aldolase [Deltaproteobacteria bacterium RIFCSPHIGHO2_02_FULL_44_53]OGQ27905.1 MAG: fructose-6-phosphate aldolase [Deltaproteobacteria bacterium RIFCSPHIGHO2_12_FULL_44_21]OGQ31117.1 MAG: fructose-6-phosphate aldolase [Deltaproteobacteria bacterium RIFCSPLOWO2_01_FULL_45_74]OGQ38211.1 MAG: fructose-6-phosphate aldolase [Deltaproteobacteria bacterium RIFCSPLOWO2_01_
MKIFIDSADINEIKEANAMGVLDGVTTNPTLIAKTGRDFKTVAKEILQEVKGPVSLETVSLTAKGMIDEGHRLADYAPNVVVKIPSTTEGLKAIKQLTSEGIKTNCTLCFSPNQALLIAKAGSTIVSPFVGRLDDISETGMDLIRECVQIYKNYNYKTEVLVASVRNPIHVKEAALCGAHICTLPFAVIKQLMQHPLTDAGIDKFLKDWEKVPSKPF